MLSSVPDRKTLVGIPLAFAALLVVFVLESFAARSFVFPVVSDFRVVYCGECAVVLQHADPYRVEPLRACEHLHVEADEPAWSVTPYPLPSYAAALLAPFALLPFGAARLAWIALLVLCFAIASASIARISGSPAFAVGLVFAPTLGILNLRYGEPVLISVALFCIAALAVHRERPNAAAVAAVLSLIEPHVGLPAVLGLFVFVPGARRAIAIAIAVLIAIGFATLGFGTNVEYARFLSAQARVELWASDQFSLSRLLFTLGVAPKIALALGSVSYGTMTVFGIALAGSFVRRRFSRAVVVVVPVALAMLGGPFVHDVQIASALPSAVVLAERTWTARAAIALLALDWTESIVEKVVPICAAASGAGSIALRNTPGIRRIFYAPGIAIAVIACAFFVSSFEPKPIISSDSRTIPPIAASGLSSIPWGWRIRLTPEWSVDRLDTAIGKIPTWIGLILIPFSALVGKRDDRLIARSLDR